MADSARGDADGETVRETLDWLLEEEQPAMRYRTLSELLGRSRRDPDVQAARAAIPRRGWAADILAQRDPEGWWVGGTSLYRPKYLATNWQLLVLSDLGLTRDLPAIRQSCELWMERFAKPDGGFGVDVGAKSHLCIAGNTARALVRFGYAGHPRVRSAFRWLAAQSHPRGGWSCWGYGRNLDSWEGLSAFSVYPRARWTRAMKSAAARGAQYYLERELYRQGERYAPWFRFHYPVHYYYDLLVGLDTLTALGYGADPRLEYALSVLRDKQRPDGRWNLDGVHPDVAGALAVWLRRNPQRRPKPSSLERPGRPSKMVTLRALTVQARVEASRRRSVRRAPGVPRPHSPVPLTAGARAEGPERSGVAAREPPA